MKLKMYKGFFIIVVMEQNIMNCSIGIILILEFPCCPRTIRNHNVRRFLLERAKVKENNKALFDCVCEF